MNRAEILDAAMFAAVFFGLLYFDVLAALMLRAWGVK